MSLKPKPLSSAIAAAVPPLEEVVDIAAAAQVGPTTIDELLQAAFTEFQANRADAGDEAAFLEVVRTLLQYQAQVHAVLAEASPVVFTEEQIVKAAQRVCELAGKRWWQIGMPMRDHLIATQRDVFAHAFAPDLPNPEPVKE